MTFPSFWQLFCSGSRLPARVVRSPARAGGVGASHLRRFGGCFVAIHACRRGSQAHPRANAIMWAFRGCRQWSVWTPLRSSADRELGGRRSRGQARTCKRSAFEFSVWFAHACSRLRTPAGACSRLLAPIHACCFLLVSGLSKRLSSGLRRFRWFDRLPFPACKPKFCWSDVTYVLQCFSLRQPVGESPLGVVAAVL